MGRVIITEFVSLDGVMEDPGGSEAHQHGGWAFQFERGEEGDKFKLDELMEADVLLLGRRTYEGFAAAWPERTDELGFAEKMNSMRKVVVSSTIEDPEWNNTTVISGDLAGEIGRLKAEDGGDVLVAGSALLVAALVEHDLVDVLRLMVFPIVLGKGKRLFGDPDASKPFRLVETKQSAQVALLTLER